MIQNTFIFLEGISYKKEKNIWKQGINDWQCFLNNKKIKGISDFRKQYYNRRIIEAQSKLYNFDSNYFNSVLPQCEMWRLYDFFKEDAVFLDIETDSIQSFGSITVFGLYDGIATKIMIKDINLDFKALKNELKKYKMIVTFNGSSFDIPFIKKRYPELLPDVAHFDIRSISRRVSLDGGLKTIEKKLGIKRNKLIDEFNGGDALTLWKMYNSTGDEHYLNLLVEYNEEDVINLKKVAEYCVEKMKRKLNSIV